MSSFAIREKIKPRLQWIEIARVIALVSVILQHVPPPCPLNGPILNASLALFFLVAGFFSSNALFEPKQSVVKWCRARVLTLLYPYLIWNTLYMLLSGAFFHGEGNYFIYLLNEYGICSAPSLTPLWFLRDLMLFTIIGALLSRFPLVLCALGIVALFVNRIGDSCQYPSFLMFGDFVVGLMLARIPRVIDSWRQLPLSLHGGLVLGYTALAIVYAAGVREDFSSISSGLGVAALLSLGVIIEETWPRIATRMMSLAQGCFFVYCSHIFVLIIFLGLFKLFDSEIPAWVWWSTVPFVYAGAQGAYILLRRFCPHSLRLLGMQKANKKSSLG